MIHLDNVRLREYLQALSSPTAIGFSGSFESPPRLHQTIPGAHPSTLLRDATVARRGTEEITVFKAVGSAIADLAMAQFFLRRHHETPTTGTGAIR